MSRHEARHASYRCLPALAWCFALGYVAPAASAAPTLAEKARESGCVDKPAVVEGSTYRCVTRSGAYSYFNVPSANGAIAMAPDRSNRKSDKQVSPPGFPRVDSETQKGRDELRRKVLNDELAAEEKFLADARAAFGTGAPAPLPEEQADAEKYRQRISRLRSAVQLHERNIEALKKELGPAR